MFKVLITGGHLSPALAFIDYCQKHHPEVEIIFVGRKYAQKETQQLSWEKEALEQRKIKFIAFEGEKSHGFNLVAFIYSFRQAELILKAEKATHVLSFGGYLALPFVLAGKALHLGLVTHEQTRVLGLANRLISPLVDFLALSYQGTKGVFVRTGKYTGLPLRQTLFHPPKQAPIWFKSKSQRLPLIYIAGGSQGSQILNQNILPLLAPLRQKYVLIHQVGRASVKHQPLKDIDTYLKEHNLVCPHYYPREFLTEQELAYFLPQVHLAISRAGANTVTELTAFQIPTIYIPLPFANYQEQLLNAQALVQQKGAVIITQEQLTPYALLEQIELLTNQVETIRANLSPFSYNQRASEKIFELLLQCSPKAKK